MKSKILAILTLASIILTLCSCTVNDNKTDNIKPIGDSVNSVLASVPGHIDKTISNGEIDVVIAAPVSVPKGGSIEEVLLTYEDTYTERMVNSLIYDIYDNVEHPSSYQWLVFRDSDSLRCSYSIEPNSLMSYYNNSDADYSGTYYDYEHIMDYGFFTQHTVSSDNNFGVGNAINEVKLYFEDYSDLSFEPYRVLAADTGNGDGYYTVWTQCEYNGVSICPRLSNSPTGLGVTSWVSAGDGVYSFQGIFALKATKQVPIESLVPFDSVFDLFCNNVSLFVSDDLEINSIKLEYFADKAYSDSYSLRPVWSFYGVANQNGTQIEWVFCYYADNGEFCYAGPLFY